MIRLLGLREEREQKAVDHMLKAHEEALEDPGLTIPGYETRLSFTGLINWLRHVK